MYCTVVIQNVMYCRTDKSVLYSPTWLRKPILFCTVVEFYDVMDILIPFLRCFQGWFIVELSL